jgi:hypothetical protein
MEDRSQLSGDIDPETGNFLHKKGELTDEEREAEEVAEGIKASIEKILGQIKEQISQGEYSLILGDDCSGRIPAEIIYQTIKRVYEKKGYDKPRITFATSVRDDVKGEHSQLIADHLKTHGYGSGGGEKALIVTESMTSGASVKVLTRAVEELGYRWDVATLNRYEPFYWPDKSFWEKLKEIFQKKSNVGRIIEGIPDSNRYVMDRPDLAGVEKKYDDDVVSERTPEDDQETVNAMREAIDGLSEELAREFLDAA